MATECPYCLGAGEIEMCDECSDLVDYCSDESHAIGYYNDRCDDCDGTGEVPADEDGDDSDD